MKGSVNFQVQQIFAQVNCINQSKHAAKEEARNNGARTWHEVGKHIGIYGYKTADDYRGIWRDLGDYVKSTFGFNSRTFDLEKLNQEHVASFLSAKIAVGLSANTLSKYCAALEKLEAALCRHAEAHNTGMSYGWDLGGIRAEVQEKLDRFSGNRAYDAPQALVSAMVDPDARLAASVILGGGARIAEATYVKEEQLLGVGPDPWTGKESGSLQIDSGKGGKEYAVFLPVAVYRELEKAVAAGDGLFAVAPDAVRDGLKEAAARIGETYEGHGSHGLRWNHAISRMDELQQAGLSYEQSLSIVSGEMGHSRSDISEHYLGK